MLGKKIQLSGNSKQFIIICSTMNLKEYYYLKQNLLPFTTISSMFILLLVYIFKNVWKILQNELDMSKRLDWLFVFMLSPRKWSQKQQLARKVEALHISYFTFCYVILYPDIKTFFHIFNKWIVYWGNNCFLLNLFT